MELKITLTNREKEVLDAMLVMGANAMYGRYSEKSVEIADNLVDRIEALIRESEKN